MAEATDYDAAYNEWKASPTPEANASVLRTLDPVINGAANTHVGRVNPLIKGKARSLTLNALQSYDPKKGKLTTHIYNQLQGLKRFSAQTAAGVYVPERVSLDKRALGLANQELKDTLGREPTDDELSDHSGFSPGRIKQVRSVNPAMSTGFFSQLGENSEGLDPAVNKQSGLNQTWEKLVMSEMSPIDQKIVEYHKQGLQNQQIAAKLRLTPGRVSQRKKVIQEAFDREADLSPF